VRSSRIDLENQRAEVPLSNQNIDILSIGRFPGYLVLKSAYPSQA
jgi:hypothetical protein